MTECMIFELSSKVLNQKRTLNAFHILKLEKHKDVIACYKDGITTFENIDWKAMEKLSHEWLRTAAFDLWRWQSGEDYLRCYLFRLFQKADRFHQQLISSIYPIEFFAYKEWMHFSHPVLYFLYYEVDTEENLEKQFGKVDGIRETGAM